MGGWEVLDEVSRDDRLRHLPIVILTTSDAEGDVLASYKLGCRSYVVKPIDFQSFSKVVRGLAEYWFTVVALPPAAR
jgi:two-component system response regulator